MQAQKNSRVTREYRELLDKNLPKKWKHLVSTTFAGTFLFLQDAVSTLEVAWIWVCSVDEEEKWQEKKLKTNLRKPNSTSCSIPSLDFYDPSSLEDSRDKPNDDDIEKFFGPANRPIGPLGPNGKFTWPLNEMLWPSEWTNKGLDKRGSGKRRPFNPMCNNAAKTTWLMHSEPYPSGDNGDFFEKKTGDNKRYWVGNIKDDDTVRHALEQLMLVKQIFPYLGKDNINANLKDANKVVIALLDEFNALYQSQHNAYPLGLSTMWKDFMFTLLTNFQEFAKD
ncbi:hypothetical protein FOMG_09030 [Fusarium oxysporum f. sp. melonis 26406]|uniref:Uncharacterized protein n=1 Tax=Fusarium oxysporum f. sp. melonis 26406 TaxID=1089452 RepID=W9ZVE0_FUSOX|nr:hypothetical protein FOMG_09030 [Fusarium oxysporum f. sp. melonis 26406]